MSRAPGRWSKNATSAPASGEVGAQRDHDGVEVRQAVGSTTSADVSRVGQRRDLVERAFDQVGVAGVRRDRPRGARSSAGSQDCRRPGAGERAGRLGDPPQGPFEVHRRLEGLGQLGGRLEPLAASLAEAVGAGVLDHEPGGARERLHEELVLLGERFAAGLLGQVEVAEDGAPDPDRDAEERGHRRVVGREADRLRMGRQVGHPDRLGLVDQQAEDAAPAWQVTDQPVLLLADPGGHELHQRPVGADHAEGGVPRPGQLGRGLDDPQEHAAQVEVGGDGGDRFEQRLGRAGQDGPSIVHGHSVHRPRTPAERTCQTTRRTGRSRSGSQPCPEPPPGQLGPAQPEVRASGRPRPRAAAATPTRCARARRGRG